jgi:hypothetical protein
MSKLCRSLENRGRHVTSFHRLHEELGALASKQLFFIGGSPKSGTTWLQVLLDSHKAIACKGESQIINHLAKYLMQGLDKQNHLLAQKNTTVFAELPPAPLYNLDDLAYLMGASLLLFLSKASSDSTVAAIGEKTPDNVRNFDVLHTIFPQAKFIHLVRDGRDCAVSGWFHMQRIVPEGDSARPTSLNAYVEMFAREWGKDLAEGNTFAAKHPDACLTVRYEDLVRDPLPTLRGILDFLGVASDDAAIAACREAGAFERLSGGRAAGQESRASFFRNGIPGDWQRHLDGDLAEIFRCAAAPWLERLGYA